MIEYIDMINEMQHDNEEQQTIAVAFNNYFASFGPQSVNSFLKLMYRPAINDLTKEIEKSNSFHKTRDDDHQTSIYDYNYIKIYNIIKL
jgi:hypothetical protein